jgi:hypothetical protein
MPSFKRFIPLSILATILALSVSFVYAMPGPSACLIVGKAGLHQLPDGSLTDAASAAEHTRLTQLTQASRQRIEQAWGVPQAQPLLVYFNGNAQIGWLKFNPFGSAHFIGSRACVFIGARGQHVDVVAHELAHAEIHQRAGFWAYFTQIPTWFDEGLAMQVDQRPRYALAAEDAPGKEAVRQLQSPASFFAGSEEQVVRNYAQARAVVAEWVARVGPASVYAQLDQLRRGKSFDALIK